MPRLGASYSEQRISAAIPPVPASDEGARRLGSAYWEEVARSLRGLVRPRRSDEGIELVLLRALPLLRFGRAETTVDGDRIECRYPIRGGLLASGPGGFLVLAQRGTEPTEVSIAVTEFRSRLAVDGRIGVRRRLFDILQIPLHERVGRRYLARAERGPL
ncbi:MAG: hypothetical protein R6W48_05055 [Gaiellaceae bacterium]